MNNIAGSCFKNTYKSQQYIWEVDKIKQMAQKSFKAFSNL